MNLTQRRKCVVSLLTNEVTKEPLNAFSVGFGAVLSAYLSKYGL